MQSMIRSIASAEQQIKTSKGPISISELDRAVSKDVNSIFPVRRPVAFSNRDNFYVFKGGAEIIRNPYLVRSARLTTI